MKRPRRQHPERAVHIAVAEHLRLRGKPGLVWWHTPNGGSRDVREAAALKRMGVLPGVSDFLMLHNGKLFSLELKPEVGGRLSEEQMAFLAAVNSAGGYASAARGIDEALRVLQAWELIR